MVDPYALPIQPWIPADGPGDAGLGYREYPVPPCFRDWAACVWSLTCEASRNAEAVYHVIPDGCSDLIFTQLEQRGSIFGTLDQAVAIPVRPGQRVFGVRLQVHALPAVVRAPASEFRGANPTFQEASLPELQDLFEAHAAHPVDAVRAARLVRRLSSVLRPGRTDPRAARLVAALRHGGPRVETAARLTGLSPRQMQRVADRELGLAPKEFSRILRVQRAMALLRTLRMPHAAIALEAGYADQAHMIREFQVLTGYSPKFWWNRRMREVAGSPEAPGGARGSAVQNVRDVQSDGPPPRHHPPR